MNNQLTSNNIFLIGIIFRLFICLFFIIFPFEHARYGHISPFLYQELVDLDFYLRFNNVLDFNSEYSKNFLKIYRDLFFFKYDDFYNSIRIFTENSTFSIKDFRYPGPFYPVILFITFYSVKFPILLALTIIILEIVTLRIWINYLKDKININFLLIFVFLPFPAILGFMHSSDIFFYFFSTLIFMIIKKKYIVSNIYFFILMLLTLLIRPASLSIILAVLLYIIIFEKKNYSNIISSLFCLIIGLLYYQPYFLVENIIISETAQVAKKIKILGFNSIFIENIYYYLLKTLYLFGFQPTTSGSEFVYYLRSFTGVSLLIGYIYSIIYFRDFDFFYLNLTILPIIFFLYPSWRYIVPISPLLYLYFVSFISLFFIKK